MFDWNIRIGDVLIMISLAGTCIVYAFRSGRFTENIAGMQKEITEIKEVAKAIALVVTGQAVQNNRLDNQGERMNQMESKIEALRRGDGFIAGARGVEREF